MVAERIFVEGEIWASPRGKKYMVLNVDTRGMDLPTATLMKAESPLRGKTIKRWYNDNDGWKLVREVGDSE